jgi:GNAT superfamily N-acetyltransferase
MYRNRQGQSADERAAYEQAEPDLTLVRVADVEPEHFGPLGELTVRAYEPIMADLYTTGRAETLGDAEGRSASATILVALFDRFVIGGISLIPNDPDDRTITLDHLAVDPSAQGLGAGRSLIMAAVERARTDGAKTVSAPTLPTMTAARHLLADLGFSTDHAGPGDRLIHRLPIHTD